MHAITTLRWALPTIVIVATATLAIIAFTLLSHHAFSGTAFGWP